MEMRVLIVDDEKTTRDCLVKFIPWGKYGIDEIETAQNGMSAYEAAKRRLPDLLLCDVRMPKMDGIELAEKIRTMDADCQIVFISGFADKQYLKKAISLRAVSYIEKPLNLEELETIIGEAVNQYHRSRSALALDELLKSSCKNSAALVEQEIAAQLIQKGVSFTALKKRYGNLYFDWEPRGCFRAIVLPLNWAAAADEKSRMAVEREILSLLYGFLQRQAGIGGVRFLCGLSDQKQAVIVAHNRDGLLPADALSGLLITLMGEIQFAFSGMLTLCAGIGPAQEQAEGLPISYEGACGAAARQFYSGFGRVYDSPLRTERQFTVSNGCYERFLGLLGANDYAGAAERLEQLSMEIRTSEYENIEDIRQLFRNLLFICMEKILKSGTRELTQKNEMQKILENGYRLADLSDCILGLLRRSEEGIECANPKIAEAVAFIRENYGRYDLTVKTIAEALYLTENYLSSLFKRETGKTINEYLTNLRIGRAKELLLDHTAKLYEVAGAVGFSDPNYFSLVFKKLVGCSPTKYIRLAK